MKDLINKFFGRPQSSKEDAKQRLKLLLIHDQVDLTPGQLEAMKTEILDVISKYVEIEEGESNLKLERLEDCVALTSSIPVRRVVQRSAAAQ